MQEFRAAVEAHDVDRVVELLAEDVVFRSPIVFKPYRGKESVGSLLHAVARVFEDFRYTHQMGDPERGEHALVFQARVGDKEIEGCDFLHVGDDGLVDEMFVMVRPLSATLAFAEAMRSQLEGAPS
jgi:SnoaL-like domain